MPPSYIRVRAVMWAYGRGQTDRHTHRRTDTQTRVTTIHFASSTTHAKCKNMHDEGQPSGNLLLGMLGGQCYMYDWYYDVSLSL